MWLYLGNVTKHWSTREGNSYFKTQNQTKPMGLYKQQPVPASEYYQILTLTLRHFKQGTYTAQSERGHPVTLSEKRWGNQEGQENTHVLQQLSTGRKSKI